MKNLFLVAIGGLLASCSPSKNENLTEYHSIDGMIALISDGRHAYFGPVGSKADSSRDTLTKFGSLIKKKGQCLSYGGLPVPIKQSTRHCNNDLIVVGKYRNFKELTLLMDGYRTGNVAQIPGKKSAVKYLMKKDNNVDIVRIVDAFGDGSVDLLHGSGRPILIH